MRIANYYFSSFLVKYILWILIGTLFGTISHLCFGDGRLVASLFFFKCAFIFFSTISDIAYIYNRYYPICKINIRFIELSVIVMCVSEFIIVLIETLKTDTFSLDKPLLLLLLMAAGTYLIVGIVTIVWCWKQMQKLNLSRLWALFIYIPVIRLFVLYKVLKAIDEKIKKAQLN